MLSPVEKDTAVVIVNSFTFKFKAVLVQGKGGRRIEVGTEVEMYLFFFQAEDGIRDDLVTGVQTCALPISRFREEDRVLEHVDESTAGVIFQHQKIPLSEGYCQKVVNGELPELIPDTSLLAAAQEIPETHTIPIGSHLSGPIRLNDTQLFGHLCCFSHQPNPALNVHDMSLLRAFSHLLGDR